MSNFTKDTISYSSAGVNIDAGNDLVTKIKTLAKSTHRPGVVGGIGGFAALFELPINRYEQPILVSSTDGVGTKLKLAIELKKYNSVGIDLVAMCANDLICCGAEPLFFLDYYATGKLDLAMSLAILEGIAEGCRQANMALVGGETAEMPGMYADKDFDLAGFSVGIIEKKHIIDGSRVEAGNCLIGLASSGPHSNGYSLIRKIIEKKSLALSQAFAGKTLGEILLSPTKIYVKSILSLMSATKINALAHITGGGISENLPRVIPEHLTAVIQRKSWHPAPIFTWIQQQANLDDTEMLRTFNCGVGMIIAVAKEDAAQAISHLKAQGEDAFEIGFIEPFQGQHIRYVE